MSGDVCARKVDLTFQRLTTTVGRAVSSRSKCTLEATCYNSSIFARVGSPAQGVIELCSGSSDTEGTFPARPVELSSFSSVSSSLF